MAIEDWKPRPRVPRLPTGYIVDPENPKQMLPVPEQVAALEEALDWLDRGLPLREVADTLNSKLPEDSRLSHVGILRIWDRIRPDHPRKKKVTAPTKERLTREQRMEWNRRRKVKSSKAKLSHLTKRLEKEEMELGEFKKKKEFY